MPGGGDPRPITLTSDFGTSDAYVAAMKGVILSVNPRAVIVDITHNVSPQSVIQAVVLTQSAWPLFPADAIHVAVVDPGVGTDRRAVAVQGPVGTYVGPDNGVLSSALPEKSRPDEDAPSAVSLPDGYRAHEITSLRVLRQPVSATFEGRDVFAPAAAHLSLGLRLEELGPPIDRILTYPPLRALRCADGTLLGRVVHIDRFGNLITDIRHGDLPSTDFAVEIGATAVPGPARTYGEALGLAAIVGSSGYLEVALPGGNAAAALDVAVGAPVRLRPST
jgi:S-adenosylmethionine hydrolase